VRYLTAHEVVEAATHRRKRGIGEDAVAAELLTRQAMTVPLKPVLATGKTGLRTLVAGATAVAAERAADHIDGGRGRPRDRGHRLVDRDRLTEGGLDEVGRRQVTTTLLIAELLPASQPVSVEQRP